jgi:DNA-directed RNA polymerase specialized sigma24 family protein
MRNAKGADLAELTSLYLQWRDGENGPVGNDLQIAAWKFTTRHAGDDLGHDVYLRVVQALNRLRDRQSAALPENLAAYLYQSCRNAGKDQQRQTWKYIPFSEEHIPKVRDPFNFVEHRGHSESAQK